MKFGEVKEWLCFWSQFKRIHEHKYMELEDKFVYLIQCMSPGTRTKEIIDGYPPTAENYTKVIKSMKARFDREELLVEYYDRELLTLVVKNATKSKLSITQLYDKLESHLRSLELSGMTSDKYSAMLFPLVESCIPEDI
ncbi:histone H3.3 [Trichonephila clavipes]|uniref:Histone H3.3 n=1 Tax=Trichonephila clavipes TaxID=2585209 RepID=A0A8X6VQH5_TRICX|nr:histone H3.3 [Trichonephila clavipes]